MKDIVIVEGPTGVGKTTLIARILESLPEFTMGPHRPQPDKSIAFNENNLMAWYSDALRVRRPCILDRWVYSNGAYSAVFANQGRVPHTQLEASAAHYKALVIFLRADAGVLYGRIQGRDKPRIPKTVGDIRKLIQLVERFDQEEKLCGLPKVGIRCHDGDLDSGRALAKALKAIRS